MPELPEVEIMARNLSRWLEGRCLSNIEVIDTKLQDSVWPQLVGKPIVGARRRGKYALLEFEGGLHMVFHYRMTGKTVLDPHPDRKSRLRLIIDGGGVVSFEDPRRFGTVQPVHSRDLDAFFEDKSLGPEPWPQFRDGPWWSAQLSGLRGPIKTSLMRQDRVAGLGNIAASEILFRSGVNPCLSVPLVTKASWDKLAQSVHDFIEHTLAEESGDEIRYVNQGGEGSFSVYGHAGEPCPECHTEIVRIVQAGRGTFYCPGCQPLS